MSSLPSTSTDSIDYVLLDSLAQEYLTRLRSGETVEVEEFVRRYPSLASDIRELLPSIQFAEKINDPASFDEALVESQPAIIGPFKIIRPIGRGGMGVVFEATQDPFRQKFAVKVLNQRLSRSKTLRQRFSLEAEAASRLHHPNIVPAKQFGTDADLSYIVMPLIDGVSLDVFLKEQPCPDDALNQHFQKLTTDWRKLAIVGAQVLSALSHAHQNGMIHRDIKPANLILDRDGKIWVTDFGLAKIFDSDFELSRTGDLIGTPKYMAPEQVHGVVDARSDIYSVGFTLYEILAHNCATSQRGTQIKASSAKRVLELPDIREINPEVPEALSKIIMKACAYHPETRYQSAREFELALNEVSYQGLRDRRNSPRSRAADSLRQGRNVLLLLGVIWVCAVVWLLQKPKPAASSTVDVATTQVKPPFEEYIFPESHCIVYDEPGSTDLVNVLIMVNGRTDDAEEYDEGEVFLDSKDLEMTWDETDQIIGLRFPGVDIPQGAEIQSAALCFYAERTEREPTSLRIYRIDELNPKAFAPLPYDVSRRKRSETYVDWQPDQWDRGNLYESPSVVEQVREMIDRSDWQSGNALAFVIEGSGNRVATAYDGNMHYAPILKLQYRKKTSSTANHAEVPNL